MRRSASVGHQRAVRAHADACGSLLVPTPGKHQSAPPEPATGRRVLRENRAAQDHQRFPAEPGWSLRPNAGQWNDVRPENLLYYIVEFNAIPEPATPVLVLLAAGLVALNTRRRPTAVRVSS